MFSYPKGGIQDADTEKKENKKENKNSNPNEKINERAQQAGPKPEMAWIWKIF